LRPAAHIEATGRGSCRAARRCRWSSWPVAEDEPPRHDTNGDCVRCAFSASLRPGASRATGDVVSCACWASASRAKMFAMSLYCAVFGIVPRPPSLRQVASRALTEIFRRRFVASLDSPVHWRSVSCFRSRNGPSGVRPTSTKDRQTRHQHMLVCLGKRGGTWSGEADGPMPTSPPARSKARWRK
jgi:hypothetical protein